MDFFEAQARAKKRSSRLIWLFIFAVLGTIVASYGAAWLIAGQVGDYQVDSDRAGFHYRTASAGPRPAWDPRLFAGVSLATLGVVGIAALVKWTQFSRGGAAVAESVGARHVAPNTTDLAERRLLNVVEEMAIASGVPVPAVYVLDEEPAINAFAAGLTTSDAVVAVTRGTLEKLSRDELQGVVGHEFSHVLNGDMRLNVRLSALIFGILVLGLAGRGILMGLRHTRRPRGKNAGGAIAFLLAIGVALLLIGYIGYFFGRIIQAAVSRQREYLADASAVQFTRNPAGIAGALKKIGGYALGSRIIRTKSETLGHFFFAQGFRASFGGLWATHPPLEERIRAIEPGFDGKMFEPPQVVDVTRESFQTAGFGGGQRFSPDEAARRAFAVPAAVPPVPPPPPRIPFAPGAVIAAIGSLSAEQIDRAKHLLEQIPVALRDAVRDPAGAPIVVFGLLLDADPGIRARQRQLVSARAGAAALAALEQLEPSLRALEAGQRLPLLQLALPALRGIQPGELGIFLETLDELVHADAQVSTFEFALQKLLVHTLALGRDPGRAIASLHSFAAVVPEISLVLSALAKAATQNADSAVRAFAIGASQLKLIQERLAYRAEVDFVALDAALAKLATASFPIKQRTLTAAAHVVSADGQVLVTEYELLRAVSAALDCPMPPVAVSRVLPRTDAR